VLIPVNVTLDSPAPPEGGVIALTSSNPVLLPVPATVTIPAGQTTFSFNVTAASVASTAPITLSATYGASAKTAPVRILADGAARVFGTVLDATVYDRDQPLQAVTASLTTDASNTTITDAQGAFTLYLDPGTSAVKLSLPGFATTTLTSFTAASNGSIDTGITRLKRLLSGPMNVTGRVITAAGAGVPGATGSVEGYEGTFTTDASGLYGFPGPEFWRYRLTFMKDGFPTRTDDAFVSFSVNISSVLYDFVLDTVARPVLAAVSAGPNPVVGDTPAFLTLTLSAPAPSAASGSGATASLVLSNPAATQAYDRATIPAGALSADFSLTTKTVATPQTTTITAFYGGVQLATTLNVIPATGVLSGLSLNPATVFGGFPSTGTVTLDGPAFAGGATVALSSNDTAVSVPATVTVPQGGTSATFTITTSPVAATRTATIRASYGNTRVATLTVNPPPPATLVGVAPGWVLPGDTTPVIYGSNIQPGSTVTFTGPVHPLSDLATTICTVGVNCASSALAATVDVGGAYALFAIPPGTAPGIYHLKVRSAAGIDSANNQWIAVDSVQQTRAVVPPELHQYATRIYPGQVVTGTLTGDNPVGDLADYNFYCFVATAGSRVSLTMNRVDTSLPWENPASLDPEIFVIAPDGFVYGNLQGVDNQPGVDYNASITNAILPQTGLYFVRAGTTRGSGQYRLSFNVTAMAPAPVGNRAIAFSGNHNTVPLNTLVNVQSVMLDSRGWPVAGATYTFTGQNGTGDTGTSSFLSGATGQTSLTGGAAASFKMTSQGKTRFKAALDSPLLSQLVYIPFGEAAARMGEAFDEASSELRIPVFGPAARSSARTLNVTGNGAQLSGGKIDRLPGEQLRARVDVRGEPPGKGRAPQTKGSTSPGGSSPSGAALLRTAATALSVVRQPLTISSCAGELEVFTQAGVNAASINLPFTVTLTDLTPSTGQTLPNGLVDTVTGIHGHRIENADGTSKTIRLKIDVKDSTGNAPTHPVLVSLSVGGSQHGTLIVDPDGNKVECKQASFLWHERDAQGNVIAPNEEFEYRLGTFANYVGETPDPAHPGQVLPVWGTTEGLVVTISTVDGSGSPTPLTMFTREFPVHPEPGKPHHFLSAFEVNGGTDDHLYELWTDYLITTAGNFKTGGPYSHYNSFYLMDRWNNVTFGYNGTQPVSTPQNLTVSFTNQLAGANIPDVAFPGYRTDVSWSNAGGAMPSGTYNLTLPLAFTDAEYGSGTVQQPLTLSFISGTRSALISQHDYDLRFGVNDTGWPVNVSPAATGSALPTTSDPRSGQPSIPKRLCFQVVTGTNVPLTGEVYESPHTVYDYAGRFLRTEPRDPRLETSEPGRMRLSVVDGTASPVTDIAFRVHNCPHYDHEGSPDQPTNQTGVRPCSDTPVQSTSGVITSYSVNPPGSGRGYMGIELLRAPTTPGAYYIKIESLDQAYRIHQLPSLNVDPLPAGEYKGAFALCVVQGGEFLDESFQRIDEYLVDQDTTAYFRYSSDGSATPSLVSLKSTDDDDPNTTASVDVALGRLGQSNVYIAGPFTLHPPDFVLPALRGGRTTLVGQPVLGVFGPGSKLQALFVTLEKGKSHAVVGGPPVKVEWLPRGDQEFLPSGALFGTFGPLLPGGEHRAYLGDGLRLTETTPPGPQTYQWVITVDGQTYVPLDSSNSPISLTTKTVTLDPIKKLGNWVVKVRTTSPSSTVSESPERKIPVWLETYPSALIGWIDADRVDTRQYFGSTGDQVADCQLVFGLQLAFLDQVDPFTPPLNVPPEKRPFYNAATLKCIGGSPPGRINWAGFDTKADLIAYRDQVVGYKQFSALYMRTPVLSGTRPLISAGKALIKESQGGSTEPKFGGVTFPAFASEQGPGSGELASATAGTTETFYLLHRSRVGAFARRFVCWINTGSPFCDDTQLVPFVFDKLIFAAAGPEPRLDLQRSHSCFPTFQFYVPENPGERRFPLVKRTIDPIFQNPDPNNFILNPNNYADNSVPEPGGSCRSFGE
jgi:hypothetical protein